MGSHSSHKRRAHQVYIPPPPWQNEIQKPRKKLRSGIVLASLGGILLFGSFEAQLLNGSDVFMNMMLGYGIYLGGIILLIGFLMLIMSFVLD